MDAKRAADMLRRLARNSQGAYQGPVRARVLAQDAGANVNTICVEVLTSDDEADANWPELCGIEVPRFVFAGAATGLYCRIDAGALVRIAFYEGDRNRPYLDAVLGNGESPDFAGLTWFLKALAAFIKVGDASILMNADTIRGDAPGGSGLVQFSAAGVSTLSLIDAQAELKGPLGRVAGGNAELAATGEGGGGEATVTGTSKALVDAPLVQIGAGAVIPAVRGGALVTALIQLATKLVDGTGILPPDKAAFLAAMPAVLSTKVVIE